jgi:hypothetical protein
MTATDHAVGVPLDRTPETRGRTLEEFEDDFREHDAGHFVHTPPAGVHGS